MNALIEFFIRRPKLANLLMISILLLGFLGAIKVQNQGYPPVDFGVVNITTVYPGASPEDVEKKVTVKIEDELSSINGIKNFSSMSIESISQIQIQIEDSADSDNVKREIREAVNKVEDLPLDIVSQPKIVEVNNDRMPVIELVLHGPVSESELRTSASSLENALKTSSIIGNVSKLGYRNREIHVNADPNKMDAAYVSMAQLAMAIQERNIQESAGDILLNNDTLKKVRVSSLYDSLTSVKDVIIRSGFDGNAVRVKDIALVKSDFEETNKRYRFNGNQSINLIVFKKESADIIEVSKAANAIIETFSAQLPTDVKLDIVVDYSNETKRLLNLVMSNAQIGLLLVLITLIIFLNARVAFWTAAGIPVCLFFAFIIFPFVGVTINFISLMGIIIVLGILVDDAIIVAENIYKYKQQGLPGVDAAIRGTKDVLWPVFTTVVTTILAFSPLIAMTGVMGKFMWSMPVVVSLVLIGSLIESLLILPSHIAHSKLVKRPEYIVNFGNRMLSGYRRIVTVTLLNPIKTVLVFFVILISAIVLLITKMDFVLFDSNDGMYAFVSYELPVGSTLSKTIQKTAEIESIVAGLPESEMRNFVTTIGEKSPLISSRGQDLNSENVGHIVIHLTEIGTRDRRATDIIVELKSKLSQLSGFKHIEVDKIPEGPPVGRAVTVTIISNNDADRNSVVSSLMTHLRSIPSLYNIESNESEGKKKLMIDLNYDRLARLGITASQVSQTLRMAYSGRIVTSVRRGGEDIDYRVQLDDAFQNELADLEQLKVMNNAGKLVPIQNVIRITETSDAREYHHYDGDRAVTVYADIDSAVTDTDLNTAIKVNRNVVSYIQPLVAQYSGMRLEIGGEEKDSQEAMKSLFIAMVLALIGIYFVLVILFDSFLQPLLVMIAIPFSFSGIVFTFFFHQMVFGFMAILGLIGLTGIVVNDSLILISMINKQVAKDGGVTVESLAIASESRLRPIFLTTITTAAGLLPTAYGFGGDNPFLVPMIMSVAWGLIFATVITLFLIPALYLLLHQISESSLVLRLIQLKRKVST